MLPLTKFNALRSQWSECFIQKVDKFRNSDPSTCRAYILKALTYIFALSSTPGCLQYSISYEEPGTDSQLAMRLKLNKEHNNSSVLTIEQ